MISIAELDEMIEAGYGDTPRIYIPEDWRERPGPDGSGRKERREIRSGVDIPRIRNKVRRTTRTFDYYGNRVYSRV